MITCTLYDVLVNAHILENLAEISCMSVLLCTNVQVENVFSCSVHVYVYVDDTLETVANNDSYLHAVDGNHCKLTPCRKVLHEIGNESPALCTPDGKSATKSTTAASQERRRRRSKSMRVGSHTTAPHTPVVASVNKSGK